MQTHARQNLRCSNELHPKERRMTPTLRYPEVGICFYAASTRPFSNGPTANPSHVASTISSDSTLPLCTRFQLSATGQMQRQLHILTANAREPPNNRAAVTFPDGSTRTGTRPLGFKSYTSLAPAMRQSCGTRKVQEHTQNPKLLRKQSGKHRMPSQWK